MVEKREKILIGVIVILVIVVVCLIVIRNTSKQSTSQQSTMKDNFMIAHIPSDLTASQKAELKAGSDAHQSKNLTFNITGGSFYFTPNEIKVKQGDKVTIIFNNIGGLHNLTLEAFNIQTKTINTGESDTVTFTANKKGTFEFYCGVGKGYHRMMGQIGVLLVE